MTRDDPARVVIGATGYTGGLVARELARTGAPLVLAGRSPDRLKRLATDLGAGTPQVVDVTDRGSLRRLLRADDVVINTAGPFSELGAPVVEACIEAGAHYVDTSGEQPYMQAIQTRYDEAARTAGVAVVPAMAFEYALGDCAASLAAEGLGEPLRSMDVIYAWRGTGSSRGTRRTVLRMLGTKGWFHRGGSLVRRSQGRGHRTVRLAGGRTLHAVGFASGEILTVPRRLEVRDLRGWLVMGRTAARIAPWLSPALPVLIPLLRPLIEPLVTRSPDPTPQERAESTFTIRVEAVGADGEARAVEVRGADAYGVTAATAVAGAGRALEPDAPSGVLGPAELVAPGPFLASLADRGVRVAVDREP
jgi:short subunit dehydrogenase-like uncharacterized protein